MPHEQVTIDTRDGACPAHVLTPEGAGPWPAVIVYMDAVGIRPTMIEMARRLASHGYVVLLPDMFYRYGPYGPFVPAELLGGDFMAVLGPLMATTGNARAGEDTEDFLAYLDSRGDILGSKIGVVGFCMGGAMAIAVAGHLPERVAAAISFHGGNLATDAPDSPHLAAASIRGEVYVAAAADDPHYDGGMAKRLEAALTAEGVRYRAETYPAAHGWMKPDLPVYDEAQAERGWREMLALFDRTLRTRD